MTVGEERFIMGKARCRVERVYHPKARLRNVEVLLLENYKHLKALRRVVMPVRKLHLKRRKK